jgi:4-azaleucine resistance transporter AzlC
MRRLWQDHEWRTEFDRGFRDMLPMYPGILAWGLVTGVAMTKGGLGVGYALFMTFIAYAGSAQLASLPLIAAAAPVWVIGVTALVTNLRFVIYGAAMRPSLSDYSPRRRAFIGYLSGDFTFVLLMARTAREGRFPHRDAWLLGTAVSNWVAWQGSSVAGIVGAAFIPTEWGLEFAGTLALVALVVPLCRQRAGAAGALTAGLVALLGHAWPYRSGLLAGVVAGIVVATIVDDLSDAGVEVRK